MSCEFCVFANSWICGLCGQDQVITRLALIARLWLRHRPTAQWQPRCSRAATWRSCARLWTSLASERRFPRCAASSEGIGKRQSEGVCKKLCGSGWGEFARGVQLCERQRGSFICWRLPVLTQPSAPIEGRRESACWSGSWSSCW